MELISLTQGSFASPTGGASRFANIDVQPNNTTVVKASAGTLYTLHATNNNATASRFLKLYDKATAPTNGTDASLFMTIELPPLWSGPIALPPMGLAFTAGLTYRATTGVAASDTGAPSTNDVLIGGTYQ